MSLQRHLRRALGISLAAVIFLVATPAFADRYDPEYAGHPLRFIAYVTHPIGVMFDYLLLRPAHWVVEHEPFATLFGHDSD